MERATMVIPAEEGIEFLDKARAVVDEVIKLPIKEMPLSLIGAMLDLRDACTALSEAMSEVRANASNR